MTASDSCKKFHLSREIESFREMFGMGQKAVVVELGDDLSRNKWEKGSLQQLLNKRS